MARKCVKDMDEKQRKAVMSKVRGSSLEELCGKKTAVVIW
tara:strand:- start:380 stop:499 length:120 start_codon:yes stop_codon:yes gene_type:complete